MGTDKATLRLNGRPLVEQAIALLHTVFDDVRIVGSRPDLATYAPIVPDVREGCGPLSGIEAALALSIDYAVFVPVDLPLLPAALLHLLVARVACTGALCTIPRFQGAIQPLCAVYHSSLLPAITASLDAGDYKVMRVVERASGALQAWGAVDCFDLEAVLAAGVTATWPAVRHNIFLNCNTPVEFGRIAQQVH